ncbi:MAG: alpha-glycosidase, partial [Lachnospiraceae bacterium]|nr:alpha-glycosidase [Lachnospiraceae bacterium]
MGTPFIFCDETELFRIPADPGEKEAFSLRVWVERMPELSVSFFCRSDSGSLILEARKWGERGIWDIWEASHPGTAEELFYFVQVKQGEASYLFGRNGLKGAEEIVPFSVNPFFRVPDWARGALWYQIFPDRFYNADPHNDVLTGEIFDDVELVSRKMRWEDPVTALDVHHYYGGDLKGILEKLDYLAGLGVEVLYLNPVFVSPSNHGYNTQDYRHVDPHLGRIEEDGEGGDRYRIRTCSEANWKASDALLADLIAAAHSKGIRVVLDGVFNHCSSFHAWYNEAGLYGKEEERPDYFRDDPESGEKECWWGNKNLLKLNVDGSEELREELYQIAEKWMKPPYGADGWRLDVAADVGHSPEANHAFWREFRRRVRCANPEALILAEHYGDPSGWLGGDEWDSVMNYDAFMEPVSWFF